jgi:magnesium-transporting ATPase (P-type)
MRGNALVNKAERNPAWMLEMSADLLRESDTDFASGRDLVRPAATVLHSPPPAATTTASSASMTVQETRTVQGRYRPGAGARPASVAALLRAAVLCSGDDGAEPAPGDEASDDALARAAEAAGVPVEEERLFNPRLDALPAAPHRPLFATLHLNAYLGQAIYLRGTPEAVVERCGSWAGGAPLDRASVLREVLEMAAAGMRVLAVAERVPRRAIPRLTDAEVAEGCALYGLVGLAGDPER